MSRDTLVNGIFWAALALASLMLVAASLIHYNGPYYRCYYFDKDTSPKPTMGMVFESEGTNHFIAVYEADCEYKDQRFHCGEDIYAYCREITFEKYIKEVHRARSKQGL